MVICVVDQHNKVLFLTCLGILVKLKIDGVEINIIYQNLTKKTYTIFNVNLFAIL